MRNTLAAAFALALLAQLALAASCASSSPPPAQPQRAAADPADAEGDRPAPGTAAEELPGAPLDEAECNALADHLVDVSLTERRAGTSGTSGTSGKPGEAFTAEDAEAAKRELRQAMKPACPQLPRRHFSCAMAARTTAALGACER